MIVMANDVKTKGVSLFDKLLATEDEVVISVRGKNKYAVIDMERFKKLRALELDDAYRQAMADIQAGRYKTLSADEHLAELEAELARDLQNR